MSTHNSEAVAVPRHVAIVMDGNGRWARRRFLPRVVGHEQGMQTLLRVLDDFAARGVEYLTVFAFSSENWKRPEEEVSGIMGLVLTGVSRYLRKLAAEGVRIRVIGDHSALSPKLRAAWDEAERSTVANTRIHLSVAFNYGGRWDIVQACRRALADGLVPEQIDEAALAARMALSFAPDPDLFIRTGGEMRVSNFLLWQTAYAELYFSDCLWPDFGGAEVEAALAAYACRERRFGGVREDESVPQGA
ncbi:MAG: di-trans,poly-cis-decaprenylcistransferase [Rubrivivax sp. SCN 71-131]|jgi:undecaprenyl diphosphate synthase|nr:MAG: di-trans,poly-cis-decaprenylcistransferase [Rubrivivax sp. SCN 71-131]